MGIRMDDSEVLAANRTAWDRAVERENRWTLPVDPDRIAEARNGKIDLLLTPTRPVPRDWFPSLSGCEILCLASAGGQQAPLLAAAGARVTVLDASPRQLDQDRLVAQREGLDIQLIEGDMADLSMLEERSFDLVLNPVSTCFVPRVAPVWREAFRVLRPGGHLLAGLANPVLYIFNDDLDEGMRDLTVKHKIPYSDLESLPEATRRRYENEGLPFEFGHSLDDLIGGQLEAGFVLVGFYEDRWSRPDSALSDYICPYLATRALRPVG